MSEVRCKYTELVDINKIIENPKNTNKHSDEQVSLLVKLIDKHGFRHPLIVSSRTGFLVAGHARLAAARKLGLKSVPVDYQEFENEAMEFAFLNADNESARMAELDNTKLIDEIKSMNLPENFDLELFGLINFSIAEADPVFAELDDLPENKSDKKHIIEVEFPNDMEMMDIHDDLVTRGYIVKVK